MARTVIRLAIVAIVAFAAGKATATTYVGFGAGPAFGGAARIVTHGSTTEGPVSDTLNGLAMGYGVEAQFGWESAKWIDFEGALRYNAFSLNHEAAPVEGSDPEYITSYSLVGFEGGIRVHMERILTNSTPYIRGGLASYSPSIEFNHGSRTISNDTVLGYYVGLGQVLEINSAIGVDVRATFAQFYAFSKREWGMNLRSSLLTVAIALIIF